ncbi:hypothetical protein [Motiliproteus coralliicola]|uniref:hypothetical protein n=1 Tax=Motiliproteus coralliicola TaxID=2283196 RepID=UPI0010589F2F|nr:hypothetical protein [Motiliproteus coralliicola]
MFYPREAKRDFYYTSRIWSLILTFPFIGLILISKNSAISYAAINAFPVEATASVSSVKDSATRRKSIVIYYSFSDSSGKTQVGQYIKSYKKRHLKLYKTKEISIIYSSLLPKFSTAKEGRYDNSISFYIFLGGSIVIILCIVFNFYSFYKTTKLKKEDIYY